MHIENATLKQLDLHNVVQETLTQSFDHFPPLIFDRCLQNSSEAIAKHISSVYASGGRIPAEVITMPRKGFGPRPISLTTLAARTLYAALVKAIDNDLPPLSRATGNWDRHRRFGLEGQHDYVVELDIASCYEYIDHAQLQDELMIRSMNRNVSTTLSRYLEEILGRSRGLPQMLLASDRLADAYLSILERRLSRDGHIMSRYVDDFRVGASNWEEANTVIEQAAEYARDLGLTLSSEKTLIFKRETLIDQDREDAEFFNYYFANAKAALTQIFYVASDYEEVEEVSIEPEEKIAGQAAARAILSDLHRLMKDPTTSPQPPYIRFIPKALATLQDDTYRLDDDLLIDIVFEYPNRIEQVTRYLLGRASHATSENHLESIAKLASMGRQSPWSKLWVLHATEMLTWQGANRPESLTKWVMQQMGDRHETVRAEAAWVCSTFGLLSPDWASYLYKNASPITQPALAAAVTRQSGLPNSLRRGIQDDSPLNREASKWSGGAPS